MSKELNTLELTNSTIVVAVEEVTTLDNLCLALIGGGDMPVSI